MELPGPETWKRINDVLAAALERAPGERDAFLSEATSDSSPPASSPPGSSVARLTAGVGSSPSSAACASSAIQGVAGRHRKSVSAVV
jgi:hypothetical protein